MAKRKKLSIKMFKTFATVQYTLTRLLFVNVS